MNAAVTVELKCYVFKCLGCDTIAQAERSDTLTCSNACRVRAHRSGRIKQRMMDAIASGVARAGNMTPRQGAAFMARCDAILDLCPDRMAEVEAGAVTLEGLQPEANRRFTRLVFDEVRGNRKTRP